MYRPQCKKQKTEEPPVESTELRNVTEEPPVESTVLKNVTEEPPVEFTLLEQMTEDPHLESTLLNNVNEEQPVGSTILEKVTEEPPLVSTLLKNVTEEPPLEYTLLKNVTEEQPVRSTILEKVTEEPPLVSTLLKNVTEEPPLEYTLLKNVTEEQPVRSSIIEKVTEEPPLVSTLLKNVTEEPPLESTLLKNVTEEPPVESILLKNVSEEPPAELILQITVDQLETQHELTFAGTATVHDVKAEAARLFDIEILEQEWKGWPDAMKHHSVTLAALGIGQRQLLNVGRKTNVKPAPIEPQWWQEGVDDLIEREGPEIQEKAVENVVPVLIKDLLDCSTECLISKTKVVIACFVGQLVGINLSDPNAPIFTFQDETGTIQAINNAAAKHRAAELRQMYKVHGKLLSDVQSKSVNKLRLLNMKLVSPEIINHHELEAKFIRLEQQGETAK